VLFGDGTDAGSGIARWQAPPDIPVRTARARYLPGGMMWQSGIVQLGLSREFDALVFVGNATWPATWITAILGRLTGKRVFFWTHGWIVPPTGIKGLFRNAFYRLANGLLLYGHGAKEIGIRAGFDPARLHVVYNSLDVEAQTAARDRVTPEDERALRRELFGSPDIAIAMCSTRLTALRRLDLLIEAASELRRSGMQIGLLLVGDGPERQNLERLALERGVPTCFTGACYDETMLARYTMASNVTVAPGKVGLTAMQSLGYGIPVITHNDADHQMPEWEAITPGQTGSLFHRDDLPSLIEAMRPWLHSPGTDAATRARCRVIIDRFYNPEFQRRVIDRALQGLPADDLFWLHERDEAITPSAAPPGTR